MESLNIRSDRTSLDSTSSNNTMKIQEMETLNLVSKPCSPSAEPSTSSIGTSSASLSISGECGGWYPISNPWKRGRIVGHQVKFLLEYVDWEEKRMRCEKLNIPPAKCEILPFWTAGTRHLIRRARFENGTSWVLKIPFLEHFSDELDELTLECKIVSNHGHMRLEYETTLAFRTACDVRVPEIYAIDDGSNKPFPPPHSRYEAPCLYMEYLDGVTAADRIASGKPPFTKIDFLHKQLAQITARMMSVACPAAGSIRVEPVTGKLTIHPGDKYGHGFFETPEAFYKNLGRESSKFHMASEDIDAEVGAESLMLLQEFHSLYAILAPQDSFCLINDDLGFHNVLTNEKWEITAVIDIDCTYAGPWSWALKPLPLSWMDVRPESMLDTSQPLRDYQIWTKKAFGYFLNEIESALRKQGKENLAREVEKFLKSGGSELMLGLEAYQWSDHDLRMAWLAEYARLPMSPENRTNSPEST